MCCSFYSTLLICPIVILAGVQGRVQRAVFVVRGARPLGALRLGGPRGLGPQRARGQRVPPRLPRRY